MVGKQSWRGLWDAGAVAGHGAQPPAEVSMQQVQGPGSELQWGKEAGEVRPGLPSMCVQSRMEILEQNKKKGSGRLKTMIGDNYSRSFVPGCCGSMFQTPRDRSDCTERRRQRRLTPCNTWLRTARRLPSASPSLLSLLQPHAPLPSPWPRVCQTGDVSRTWPNFQGMHSLNIFLN